MSDNIENTSSEAAPAPQPAVQAVEIMGRDEVTELRAWEKEQSGDGAPRFSVDELASMDRDSGSDEDKIRQATREHRKKHPREDDPTIEWKVKGDRPLTLHQATHAKFASRQLHVGNAHGLSPEDSLRDLVPIETLPPAKMGVANDAGRVHAPLHDMYPVPLDERSGNLREITKALGNFREAQAAEQAALLAELQQAEERQAAQAAAPPPVIEQPEPAPQTQPQQDPLAIERQRLAWEQRIAAEL